MNECHPKNRTIWQAMRAEYPDRFRCAEEYLGKYADFASSSDRPTDQQLDDLFHDTAQKIGDAKVIHNRRHRLDIAEGEKGLREARREGCSPDSDLKDATTESRCYDMPIILEAEEKSHYYCEPTNIEARQESLSSAADNNCYPTTKGEAGDRCRNMGYDPIILSRHKKVNEICAGRGCTVEGTREASRKFRESVRRGCWKTDTRVAQAQHYLIDQQLKKLGVKAANAHTRMDKLEVIEGFIGIYHHRGLVLDFACNDETPPGLALNVLDCLAGNDWEKV